MCTISSPGSEALFKGKEVLWNESAFGSDSHLEGFEAPLSIPFVALSF